MAGKSNFRLPEARHSLQRMLPSCERKWSDVPLAIPCSIVMVPNVALDGSAQLVAETIAT